MRCYVAERLRVECTRQCCDAEFLHRRCNDLRALVIHSQYCVVVLVDEELQRFEQREDGFLAYFAAAPDAVFLRAHVQLCPANELLFTDQNAGGLWATDIFAAAEAYEVE